MPLKFVFDANVPICLDKIKFLNETLDYMMEVKDHIYINILNLNEISNHEIKSEIKESSICEVINHDEDSYVEFKNQLLKPAGIKPNKKDGVVLYTSHLMAVDYLVSNDLGVIDIAEKLKEKSHIENMQPFTVIGLLKYLHLSKKIPYLIFLKQSLKLFKNHEIDNIIKGIEKYQWNELDIKDRFKTYSDPIITNYGKIEGIKNE